MSFFFESYKDALIKNHAKNKVNLIIGRFQPFTIGHLKVIQNGYKINRLPFVIVVVRSKSKKNSFFSDTVTYGLINYVIKYERIVIDYVVVQTLDVFELLYKLRLNNYEPAAVFAGTDRYKDYYNMFNRYKSELNLLDDFDVFDVKRGDDDVSATKVRTSLLKNDLDSFRDMMPDYLWNFFDVLKEDLLKYNK